MDKTIEQIFKIFNHLAREIQVYIFSGFLISINIFAIDYFFYKSSFYIFIKENSLYIPCIILMYLIGHFALAFYLIILEQKKLDKKIDKFFGYDYKLEPKNYPTIYIKQREAYNHFIERYILLALMRWTISAACFINLLTNIIFIIAKEFYWQFILITVIFLIGTIAFYILTARTESENAARIEALKSIP